VDTQEFLASHPVFSLQEATAAWSPRGGTSGAAERLKHYVETGRVKLVTRGIYATVPAGVEAERFSPDRYLVARAARPEGVFSHHSALELQGAAHSEWRHCTLFVSRRRRTLELDSVRITFLSHPKALKDKGQELFATRSLEHGGEILRVTRPERTLVEGFRRPDLAGGVEELVESAAGYSVLDLDVLEELLGLYDLKVLWAAVGWFLERYQETFHVPPPVLRRLERRAPRSPQYLIRQDRGGELARRWNLVLPRAITSQEPDER
jgi:hypothetical protein